MNFQPETDAYIVNANEFATPILTRMRRIVHEECPEIKEVIKWGFPCFEHKGTLCAMAAHKTHCSFSFWKGAIMSDPDGIIETVGKTGMGHFGKIKLVEDLPGDKVIRKYLREAIELNNKDIKIPKAKQAKKKIEIPDYFLITVQSNVAAFKVFEDFSYSNKKEYVEWVTDAKTVTTRDNRLAQAVEWMSEGKVRNWKYIKAPIA